MADCGMLTGVSQDLGAIDGEGDLAHLEHPHLCGHCEHLLKAGNPVLTAGLQQLRTAVGAVAWKQVDEAKRLAVLTELQTSAFFAALRAGALEVLYRSPEMFDLVGYGGSAIEKGGYINRGFADIDWLPAATK